MTNKNDRTQVMKLGPGELFIDDDGVMGYAAIYNGHVNVRDVREWEQYEPGITEAIVRKADEISNYYPLPGRPDVVSEDRDLMTDIMRAVHPIVEFPARTDVDDTRDDGEDSRYESAFAAWIVGSHLKECFTVNPRWGLAGTTNSGKNRAQTAARLLAYHALSIGSPTSTVIFRASDWYLCTLIIDEMQDFIKSPERMTDVLDVIKLGYDKTPICRLIGTNHDALAKYSTDSYVMYSTKTWTPPEDAINRSIYVTMTKHRREVMEDTPKDGPEYQDLRGRLTALCLKVMAGTINMAPIMEKARDLAKRPVIIDGREYRLDDRSAEIGRVLIACCIVAGGDDENIEDIRQVLISSVLEATDAMCETMEGRVFFALQAVVERFEAERGKSFDPSQISTLDVKEQLNTDLIQNGNDGKWEVKTLTVTNALKSLGFKIRTGDTNNRSTFQPASFQRVYSTNLGKIGTRPYSR